ncbi:MATE family efflux transporter [Deminuibacter soli]|uniref:Multidrug-efflux transporter n=1 Tax=Deminuibacter soli TaxID=2291815 RepID=A0A3E1NJG1_9BACT|nr:MATE family efflux transporter [Deminuibacter soli]RFM28076.1 MATE family efflux transporter [Deminuibacter soli]
MVQTRPDINLQLTVSNRQILKIAMPIAASIVVPQINFITNNIFLGSLGVKSLAVAGITGVYYLIFAVIGAGLNSGLQALISRRAGENRIEEIGNLFHQGIRIALVFALAGIAITFFIAPAVLARSLHDPENLQMALHFLYIRIWGLPFLYIYQMRNALLVGTNQSKFLVIGTLAETVVNIVLDYGLIKGHWGMPAMGFNGAAVASITAEAAGLVIIFAVMRWKGISKQLQLFKNFQYDATQTRLIVEQSAPLILQNAISIVTWEFFYILIEHHGELALAVSNTMRNIFGLFGCVTWAFAATSNTMVSNIIGQQQQHRVIDLVWRIVRLSLGFAIVVCTLLNIAPGFFLRIYGQGDAFITAAIPVVRVVSLALVLQSISTIWLNAVTGTGNTVINLLSESIAIIFYGLYVYLVLEVFNLSIIYGWMSEMLYWIVLFVPSFWYMMSGRWKRKII